MVAGGSFWEKSWVCMGTKSKCLFGRTYFHWFIGLKNELGKSIVVLRKRRTHKLVHEQNKLNKQLNINPPLIEMDNYYNLWFKEKINKI